MALCTAITLTVASSVDAAGNSDAAGVPRLATLDWGIAQNLVAMGAPPIAVGQPEGYRQWVHTPPLPAQTYSMGLRAEPNRELLAQLHVDRILITRMYSAAKPALSQVAPVTTVDVYFTPGDVWDNTLAAARKLGEIAHRPQAAQALIDRTEADIRHQAARLPADHKPLLLLQFADAQHVTVYGDRSLIQATMHRMGLRNAWHGQTNRWGIARIPLASLADLKTGRVVVMGPIPVGLTDDIAHSQLWQSLPIVQNAPVLYIPPIWSFGGLPSASRFAGLIADALIQAPDSGPGWPSNGQDT